MRKVLSQIMDGVSGLEGNFFFIYLEREKKCYKPNKFEFVYAVVSTMLIKRNNN